MIPYIAKDSAAEVPSECESITFAFGQTGQNLPEDLNGDGIVDDVDLLEVLFDFGAGG
jgi:hypothetical protein